MKKGTKKLCLFLSVPFILSSIGYGNWVINTKEENIVVSGPKVEDIPVAYIVGSPDVKYTKIQRAIDVAYENGGGIVTLEPPSGKNYNSDSNPVVPSQVTYTLENDLIIREGVTLIIPTDSDSLSLIDPKSKTPLNSFLSSMKEDKRQNGSNGSYSNHASSNSKLYRRVTLEVAESVTIQNQGHLILSGYLGGGNSNSGVICQTSHSYSQIVLNKDAKIIQNSKNAVFDCLGYVFDKRFIDNSESYANSKGSVLIQNGQLNMPLVVEDYRGFMYSWALTDGAINDEGCSPFNQLGMRNIASFCQIDYGVSVYGIINVYILFTSSLMNVNEVSHSTLEIVGTSDSSMIQLKSNSNLIVEYDFSASKYNIVFNGGMSLNPLKFTISTKSPEMSVPLSTAKALFPISYQYSIVCKPSAANDNSEFDYDFSNQPIKLLPGSSLMFEEGCKVKASRLVAMSSYYCGKDYGGEGKDYGGIISYPIKDGGILVFKDNSSISANSLAGTVYCNDESQISTNEKSIICKTGWNTKSSGKTNPLWNIKEYLENQENLSIIPLSYLYKKKVFIGCNVFSSSSSFNPKVSFDFNEEGTQVVSSQRVIFRDEIENVDLELIDNVYKVFHETQVYPMGEKVKLSNDNDHFCLINSIVSVSNDNNGVNEFKVQSVEVSYGGGLTADGKIPLYLDSSIKLSAKVIDSTKSYFRDIQWSSSDSSIATVDSEGNVTALQIDKSFTIYASCGGVVGSIDLIGISKQEAVGIEEVWIEQGDYSSEEVLGSSSAFGGYTKTSDYNGKYKRSETKYKFELKISPSNGTYKSIKWTFYGEAKDRDHIFESESSQTGLSGDGNEPAIIYNQTEVWVTCDGDEGQSPDLVHLIVEVEQQDSTKKTKSAEFLICHGTPPCLLPTAKVLMSDGSFKPAGDIRTGDMVMSFNHETGRLEPNVVIGNDDIDKEPTTYDVVHLLFGNGNSTDFIYEHGYFDLTLNKYVYMHEDDVNEYIGHEFVCFDKNGNYQRTKLIKYEIQRMFTRLCSPATANHLNIIADNMLSIGGGLTGLFNIFSYDPLTLAFNKELMQQDISKYGLLGYEHFEKYFPKEIYDLLPCKYLGVSIGKGLITWDIFEGYVNKWKDQLMDNIK